MDKKELWNRFASYYRSYPEVGLSLDISRIRFPDDFFSQMSADIKRAEEEMQSLEQGAIANPDENRMVGHYWLRSPDLAPEEEITLAIKDGFSQVLDFASKVHRGEVKTSSGENFNALVVIGIGGSALGPQLLADALAPQSPPIDIFFCDNTDPDGISRTIDQLGSRLGSTLICVISKSGGTVETRNGALEFENALKNQGLDFSKQALAVTLAGSKLDKKAETEGWLARFPIWDWVGGRTSVFSAVALLPLALIGVDIQQFCEGGRKIDQITRERKGTENPAMLLSLMWFYAGNGRGEKNMVVLPYKDRLVLMSKYLQQLVMESLGKERDLEGKVVHQGINVFGNKGSTDQHAYVQQLRDGLPNFFATFIKVSKDFSENTRYRTELDVEPGITSGDYLLGFLQGTRSALFENGRESISIGIEEVSPLTLGALIALYDRAVGFYASLVRINAYHQPGVEAGKKAATAFVAVQSQLMEHLSSADLGQEGATAEEIANNLCIEDEVETVFNILEHLAANERLVSRSGSNAPKDARYQKR